MGNKEKLISKKMNDIFGGVVCKVNLRGKTVWIACEHDPRRPYQYMMTGGEYYKVFDNEKEARQFDLRMINRNRRAPYKR